jgi:hypothetical protein
MCDENESRGWKDFDPIGTKALAKTVQQVTQAGIDAAGAVLSRICLPAAKEFGLLLSDRVSEWRTLNYISTMKRLEQKLTENKVPEASHAHPRIVSSIVEQSSWIEDSAIQDMWAGLLSSSCTGTGDDDSNLLFVNLLSSLTKLQARVLNFACEKTTIAASPGGLVLAGRVQLDIDQLVEIAEEKDIHRLDRELDHLRAVGLIEGGILPHEPKFAILTPTSLALHMLVRCKGSRASPLEFFNLNSQKPL